MLRPYLRETASTGIFYLHLVFHYWTVINTLYYYFKTITVSPGSPPQVSYCAGRKCPWHYALVIGNQLTQGRDKLAVCLKGLTHRCTVSNFQTCTRLQLTEKQLELARSHPRTRYCKPCESPTWSINIQQSSNNDKQEITEHNSSLLLTCCNPGHSTVLTECRHVRTCVCRCEYETPKGPPLQHL